MELRNSEGTPVDPVPFLVVSVTGLATVLSFGPMYLLAVGLDLQGAAVGIAAAFAGTTLLAYHRYVWTARPSRRAAIPGPVRARRLYYATFAALGLVAVLALPLLV